MSLICRWILLAAVLCSVPFASGLDIEGAKERKCEDMSRYTVPTDKDWALSVKRWYYPLMARYDLYSIAGVLTNRNPIDISEDELYYEACLTWEYSPEVMVYGFGGHSKQYEAKLLDDKFETTEFYADGEFAYLCWSTMTDNKTFLVQVCCLADDQMVWVVGSTIPKLPEETVKKIHEHALSLGFKKENFSALRYDTCDPGARKQKPVDTCSKNKESGCDCQK